jgi:hypothetical protein
MANPVRKPEEGAVNRSDAVAVLRDALSPGFVSFGGGGTVQLDGHFSAPELEAVLVLMRTDYEDDDPSPHCSQCPNDPCDCKIADNE